jgi:hypothetical protein
MMRERWRETLGKYIKGRYRGEREGRKRRERKRI